MHDRRQGLISVLTGAVALLLSIGVAQPPPVGTPVAPPPTTVDLTEIVLSTVVLVRPTEADGFGSGTIVSPYGYVLTNYHVIADDNGVPSPMSFLHVSSSFTSAPEFRYVAEYVTGDAALDLAILRIVADSTFRQVPSIQRFPYLPIGNRSGLRPNQRLVVWGYPGIGGRTITSTEGTVSGFSGEDLATNGDRWIKTDAQVAPGNSGGAAITSDGILVAVPTIITGRRLTDDIAISQNWLRPADLLMELAVSVPGIEYLAIGGAASPAATTPTSPSPPTSSPQPSPASVDPAATDGVVRDAATLVARLRQGGEVIVAAGVYQLMEPLELERNVQIIGAGSRETYITSSVEGFVIRFAGPTGSGATGVTFQHLESLPADVVQVRGGIFAEFDDTRFLGAVYDERLDRGGAGLSITGSTQLVVTNSEFMENDRAGLSIAGTSRVEVTDSSFRRNPGFGIRAESGTLVVQSSTFERESSTFTEIAFAGLELLGSVVAELSDSTFTSHERNTISVYGEARLSAHGNTIDGAGLNGISVFGRAHADIEETRVVNAAAGIRIGEFASATLTANTLRSNTTGVMVGEDAEASLSNNIIDGNSETGLFAGDRARVVASENTIQNHEWGIYVEGQAAITISANTFQENDRGVSLNGTVGGVVRENIITRSNCGVCIDRAGEMHEVVNNEIRQSVTGVHVWVGDARIDGNSISDTGIGVLIEHGQAQARIEGNTIVGGNYGVAFMRLNENPFYILVRGNTISSLEGGILVRDPRGELDHYRDELADRFCAYLATMHGQNTITSWPAHKVEVGSDFACDETGVSPPRRL